MCIHVPVALFTEILRFFGLRDGSRGGEIGGVGVRVEDVDVAG